MEIFTALLVTEGRYKALRSNRINKGDKHLYIFIAGVDKTHNLSRFYYYNEIQTLYLIIQFGSHFFKVPAQQHNDQLQN